MRRLLLSYEEIERHQRVVFRNVLQTASFHQPYCRSTIASGLNRWPHVLQAQKCRRPVEMRHLAAPRKELVLRTTVRDW